ncbi:MAG TPA: CBS domain-containing protein [Candidatus Binatus sp.]|nr:CBS domain-containing protein [Candidatus Binatus sp.]
MDEWIEEDLHILADAEKTTRVLDQRMIREPIRSLGPPRPLSLPPGASIADAIRTMREHRVGCLLVVEESRLVGIITERDLLLKLEQGDLTRSVRELMTPDPEVLTLDDPIVYALNKMSVGGFRHVPLVDAARRPVGIVSVKDIIDYIVDFFPNDVLTVPPDPARAAAWRGRDGG